MDYSKAYHLVRIAADQLQSTSMSDNSFYSKLDTIVAELQASSDWEVFIECNLTMHVKSGIIAECMFIREESFREKYLFNHNTNQLVHNILQ